MDRDENRDEISAILSKYRDEDRVENRDEVHHLLNTVMRTVMRLFGNPPKMVQLAQTVMKTVMKTVMRSAGGPPQNFPLSAGAV